MLTSEKPDFPVPEAIRRLCRDRAEGEEAMATKRTTKSYDETTAAAREIIDAQDRAHDAKTHTKSISSLASPALRGAL
jgi:hypothetical protein